MDRKPGSAERHTSSEPAHAAGRGRATINPEWDANGSLTSDGVNSGHVGRAQPVERDRRGREFFLRRV